MMDQASHHPPEVDRIAENVLDLFRLERGSEVGLLLEAGAIHLKIDDLVGISYNYRPLNSVPGPTGCQISELPVIRQLG